MGVATGLRRGLGVQGEREELNMNNVDDASIVDIEAKQANLAWADDRSEPLVMDDDGKVAKLMVFRN